MHIRTSVRQRIRTSVDAIGIGLYSYFGALNTPLYMRALTFICYCGQRQLQINDSVQAVVNRSVKSHAFRVRLTHSRSISRSHAQPVKSHAFTLIHYLAKFLGKSYTLLSVTCYFVQLLSLSSMTRYRRVVKGYLGKVAIIKQQIQSMCICEALTEKCKNCRHETYCSKMLIFGSEMP